MARRRFFVDSIRDSAAWLAGEDALHLARVLRAEPGQRYEISDNIGVYLAEIESVSKVRVVFRVLEPIATTDPSVEVTLLAALFKFDRFEWMIEKATELGVARIVPVVAERSERGLDKAAVKRAGRWRRIAIEASQQSRRARLPEILDAEPFERTVARPAAARFFLDEAPGGAPLAAVAPAGEVALLAGPEGGWTDAERRGARDAGWQAVTLGPTILRAETAATAAVAVVMNAALARAARASQAGTSADR
jgi:16S rRNA (uracil1498-N3)-methyltransferase